MIISLIFLVSCTVSVKPIENLQIIEISDGKIQGKILESNAGREFSAFQGIPFAEPPVGHLRFKAPVPNKPWEGLLDATQPHAFCPQKSILNKDQGAMGGEEDCLYLNVYTPKLLTKNSEFLPVMVFFHGGGFFSGSGGYLHYGPELLLDHDIVLVIGNYRLGAFGFLSTGDEESPGNYGLKDQSLLLKWVNKNIKYFGGDPKSVTLFGESAGAASSHYHIFSPLSKGLFKAVISQSGSAFNSWALAPEGENIKNAKKLAESVNCPTSPNKELVECLRKIDPIVIVDQDVKFMEWDIDPIVPFKPAVEPQSPEAFLPDTPHNLLKAGTFEDVPLLIGTTAEEGLIKSMSLLGNPSLIDDLNNDFNNKIAISMLYKSTAKNIDLVGEKIRKFYFGDKKIDAENTFSALTDMYTDGWFANGISEAIHAYKKVSKKPIYNYIFAHNGPQSFTTMLGSSRKFYGSCHADDLLYLFPNFEGLFPNRNENREGVELSKLMTTLWTNFAKTSNPTPEINDIIKTKWEPVKSDKLEYYHLNAGEPKMENVFSGERMKFWRDLPIKNTEIIKEEL